MAQERHFCSSCAMFLTKDMNMNRNENTKYQWCEKCQSMTKWRRVIHSGGGAEPIRDGLFQCKECKDLKSTEKASRPPGW